MAEQAQAREQFQATLQACMDSKGWNLTVEDGAGFVDRFSSEDEMNRAGADRDSCLRDQGIDLGRFQRMPTEAELRAMYSQDVDTYKCLLAQGVKMEDEPPSVDLYVEQGLSTDGSQQDISESWWPYFDPAVMAMPQDEVARLEQVCPVRWAFATP